MSIPKRKSNKKKITYIISGIDKSLGFEWLAKSLDKDRFELEFILLNQRNSALAQCLKDMGFTVHELILRGKISLVLCFFKVLHILRKHKPEVIHTHLFEASVVGLTAGRILGIKKRLYTRHHSNIHHQYFPRAVYYDKVINSLATHIVAPSNQTAEVLSKLEGVSEEKIKVIPHGFDLGSFANVPIERVTGLRKKYFLTSEDYPIVGVIARYTHWKGIQTIIPAFQMLLEEFKHAKLILANARGDYQAEIRNMLQKLPNDSYIEITFEPDVQALYKLFDVYVHTPINKQAEAFGQTYVEALASGVPSVFTLSGIACDFIVNNKNALVVPYGDNSDKIYENTRNILKDSILRERLSLDGLKSVEPFQLQPMIQKLEAIYGR